MYGQREDDQHKVHKDQSGGALRDVSLRLLNQEAQCSEDSLATHLYLEKVHNGRI